MSPFEKKQKHLKGTIWTMIVIGLMVLALLILVLNSDRNILNQPGYYRNGCRLPSRSHSKPGF